MTTFLFHPVIANLCNHQPKTSSFDTSMKVPDLFGKVFHKVGSDGNIKAKTVKMKVNMAKRTTSFDENERFGLCDFSDRTSDNLSVSSVSTVSSVSAICNINSHGTTSSGKAEKAKCKKRAKQNDFVSNFKTEICKYWEDHGVCQFGDKCAFAHGDKELRQRTKVLSSFKAKKCLHFHTEMYCPYGRRCQFLHAMHETVAEPENRIKYSDRIKDPAYFEFLEAECICLLKLRLPVFQEISQNSFV